MVLRISNYKKLRHPRVANDWPMINGSFVAESKKMLVGLEKRENKASKTVLILCV